MRTRVIALLAAASAAVAVPTAASAATIIGTLTGAIFNIGSSTSVIGAGSTFTNSGSLITNNGTGDFSPVSFFTPFALSTVTATNGSAVTLSGLFGTFIGSVGSVSVSNSKLTNVVTLYTYGTFTPTGALASYDPGAASVTFSFTQGTAPGSIVSGSYTLSSPPSPIPEPAVWGLTIAGAGMAGAAVRRRRREKVAAA